MKQGVGSTKFISYLRQGLILTAAAAATHVYGLVDQAFISKISEGLLRTHYYVDYLLLVFILVGRTVGQSLLVILNKSESSQEKSGFLWGALAGTMGLAGVILKLANFAGARCSIPKA